MNRHFAAAHRSRLAALLHLKRGAYCKSLVWNAALVQTRSVHSLRVVWPSHSRPDRQWNLISGPDLRAIKPVFHSVAGMQPMGPPVGGGKRSHVRGRLNPTIRNLTPPAFDVHSEGAL